jgi:tetratricopeptide (TPR) repeat protein
MTHPRRGRFGRTAVAPLLVVVVAAVASAGATGLGCAARPVVAPTPLSPAPTVLAPQIFSPRTEGTPRELFARGEVALLGQRWREASDAFEALLAGEPDGPNTAAALLDLGLAYEGLDQREKARDRYHELATRFPNDPNARTALSNACAIHAYLEEWPALVQTAAALLARPDVDDIDRMTGLGARGLGEVELGKTDAASKDIEDGLDIVERNHYGALNRLPVPAAQLRFALGELRRARSEEISLTPPGDDFLAKMDARCSLLLSAQNAYADAIRSVDPHWAAMSGYRVGDMYRRLHHDLMEIPPVAKAKTERDKQLHFGMMHVRYRVLLEKGLEMMRRTLALAGKTADTSAWVKRTEEAKAEMERAIEDEKAQIASLPFTEDELRRALELLEAKVTGKPVPPPPRDAPVSSSPPAPANPPRK